MHCCSVINSQYSWKKVLFFFMYYRFSWTISIVQAWSATKHMIISVVHTPPMPPPWMDYGNYPMFGNLYMIWSFDLPIFVVNYHSNDSHQCPILAADFVIFYYGIENEEAIQAGAGSE